MVTASLVKDLREKTGAGMLDCKKALEASNGNMEEAITWLREKGISTAAKKEGRIAAEGLVNIVTNDTKSTIVELNSETDFVASNNEFIELVNLTSNLILENDSNNVEEALKLKTEDGTLNDTIVAKIAKIGEKISFRRFENVILGDNEIFGTYIHNTKKIAVIIVLEGDNQEVAKDVAMHAAAMRPKYIRKEDISEEEFTKEREKSLERVKAEGKPANIAEKIVEGRINKHFEDKVLMSQTFYKDETMTIEDYIKENIAKTGENIRVGQFKRIELGVSE